MLVPLLLVVGCDPCAGVGRCTAPLVRYEGNLVKAHSGKPAGGVQVEFVRTGGIPLGEDRIRTETDSLGRFQLVAEAVEEGTVLGELIFQPPGNVAPREVAGVTLRTVSSEGERLYAGEWVVPFPHLPYEAVFYHRGTGQPARGIEVEFRRTGGIEVEPDTFVVTTDFSGTVKLKPETRVSGELSGELVVTPLPPYAPYIIPDLRMQTFSEARFDSTLVRAGLGPSLPYSGIVVWEDTGRGAAGIELEFQKSSGIAIYPTPFLMTTDSFGTFRLNPAPLSSGEIEGDLVVRAPSELEGTVLARLRLSTDQTGRFVRHLGYFAIPGP